MTVILEFRQRCAQTMPVHGGARGAAASSSTAEVIIFPGIRIERGASAPGQPAPAAAERPGGSLKQGANAHAADTGGNED